MSRAVSGENGISLRRSGDHSSNAPVGRATLGKRSSLVLTLLKTLTGSEYTHSTADQPLLLHLGWITRLGLAAGTVAMALLTTIAVPPLHEQPPTLLFFAAVILTSWYAGARAGLLAAILSMAALNLFFVKSTSSLQVQLVEDGTDFVAFAAATWFVSTLQERWRRDHHRLVAIEHELEIARQIQQRLFPATAPALADFEVAGACFPAEATGGDFFDYIPMSGGCLGLVVGDVSGHGLGPALVMSLVRSYLRALARTHADPGEILTRTNGLVHEDMDDGRFATVFFGRLDPAARTFVAAGAGHEAYLIGECGPVATLKSTGVPLGILDEAEIGQNPAIVLQPRQILLLISDGIIETSSAGGEQFGIARVIETVRLHQNRPVQEIVNALYEAARTHRGNAEQQDDMTFVVVRVR